MYKLQQACSRSYTLSASLQSLLKPLVALLRAKNGPAGRCSRSARVCALGVCGLGVCALGVCALGGRLGGGVDASGCSDGQVRFSCAFGGGGGGPYWNRWVFWRFWPLVVGSFGFVELRDLAPDEHPRQGPISKAQPR